MHNSSCEHKKSSSSTIKVIQRKKYGCFCKIFCCKCIYCCQSFDFSLLTSEHRKNVFHSMIKEYIKSVEDQPNTIIDPFFILVELLMGYHDNLINEAEIYQKNSNPSNQPIISKEDLQIYIPQLCTYLVFHEQMQQIPIFDLMQRASIIDLQFALKYYLYMKSLESINQNSQFKAVVRFNKQFKQKIYQNFRHSIQPEQIDDNINQIAQCYNLRKHYNIDKFVNSKIQNIPDPVQYTSIFVEQHVMQNKQGTSFSNFQSTVNFLQDVVKIGEEILKSVEKKQVMSNYLKMINGNLPANVFLPLRKNKGKYFKVASIVYQQCRVFPTKSRAPYCLCLQVFESPLQINNQKNQKIASSTSIQSQLRRSVLFQQDSIQNINMYSQADENTSAINYQDYPKSKGQKTKNKWLKQIYSLADRAKQLYESKQHEQDINEVQDQQTEYLFGQSSSEQLQRIKKLSPFSQLPNYHLQHVMVKTNDDLRQQVFAMQLLQQFNTIFIMEQLPIRVVPYQVVPLGHNSGFIEFIKDTLTLDELRKREGSLQFIRNNPKKRRTFMNTLVGYSLITYFLQVKDRHNGNILIRRNGQIIHIDYGFFISNSPGKGVELQKKVPFKMTTEYIDTLGGIYSKKFSKFRKLFYQGYQACRKHQHRILILSKLMYSSHGTTMPCFIKGNQSIEAMEERFNPTGIRTDGDLSLFCQQLVNKSIDNWRVKWYDKWQYYMQGIFY